MTDEEEFYQSLARDFVIHTGNQIVEAVDRLPDFDPDALHTHANHLKGSGEMFGHPLLTELGAKLEGELVRRTPTGETRQDSLNTFVRFYQVGWHGMDSTRF